MVLMDWQHLIVWSIVLLAAAIAVRTGWRRLKGPRRGDCSSCGNTECPLKQQKKQ